MIEVKVKKYLPINPVLKKLIKFYWTINSEKETTIQGKLIPLNNIDLIINLSSPIKYIKGGSEEIFYKSHFSGIHNNSRIIQQNGILDVIGISFFSTGFYPFVKVPLSEFENSTIPIQSVIGNFDIYTERFIETQSNNYRISILEEILLKIIDFKLINEVGFNLIINDFIENSDLFSINSYCKQNGINQKTLERNFQKCVGTTPKSFLQVTKFQKSIKQLLIGQYNSLTETAYEHNYFDQTHFIKNFKSFVGNTPSKQLKNNDLIFNILPRN